MTGSCKPNQQRAEGFRVKLKRENVKEFILYDTTVSLDYLTGESKTTKGVSNFEFFDRFDCSLLKSELETNHLILFNDSIRITVEIEPFDTLQFKRNLASDSTHYARKPFYGLGERGILPTNQISSIGISIDGKLNEVSRSEYENMFDPNIVPTEYHVPTKAYVTDKGEILLQMDNSSGSQFYYLIFLFDTEGRLKEKIAKNVL